MKSPVTLPKALWRGFMMRCPNCGRGHLFRRFLKVVDCCGVCGEDYTPQRADDFPAYLVIIVVGHVVVPALLAVEIAFAPPAWLQLLIWVPVTGLSALSLLQPTKGTIVGLQWHSGMHGFEASRRRRDNEAAGGEARRPPSDCDAKFQITDPYGCRRSAGSWRDTGPVSHPGAH